MNDSSKKGMTLFVTLAFILSVLAVFGPMGATAGRAANFAITVNFTNATGAPIIIARLGDTVNINANVSIVDGGVNVTQLILKATANDVSIPSDTSAAPLAIGAFALNTWPWIPVSYGVYIINVTAINGTDTTNQTVETYTFWISATDFKIDAVTVTPDSGLINITDFSIVALVSNYGNLAATANVSFKLDNSQLLGYNEAGLAGQESKWVPLVTNFGGLTISNGMHTVTASLSDPHPSSNVSNSFNLTNPMTNVTIDNLTADKTSGYEGEVVTFTLSLSNSGNIDATNVTIYFDDMILGIIPDSIGNLTGLTVPMGTTGVNFTWAYTLPNITDPQVTKTIRAGYGESIFLTIVKTINITIIKKLPIIQIVSFVIPTGIRQHDDVMVNITVKNIGSGNAVGMTVKISEGGGTLNTSNPFNLTAGNSTVVSMYITIIDSGDTNQTFTATATAAGVDYTNNTTVYVSHEVVASIGIISLAISPSAMKDKPKDSTQTFTVTITLQNNGEKAGQVLLMVVEPLKILSNQSVSLDPKTSKDIKVTISIKGSGAHNIMAIVSGEVDFANLTMSANCTLTYKANAKAQPGFEVVVLVAAVLVALALVRRRKSKKT